MIGLLRTGQCAVLLVPLGLLHARSFGDAAMTVAAAAFLLRCGRGLGWDWLRRGWVPVALAWWAWLVAVSAWSGDALALGGAASALRLLAFVAAMQFDLLRDDWVRRWLYRVVAASAAYIALGAVFQLLAGVNFYGYPPWGDGELTGPFFGPRAGPPLARLLLPALLPPVAWVASRPGAGRTLLAAAMLGVGAACVLLIGQRMPLLLSVFGIVVAALLLPKLRLPALATACVLAALLAASPLIAPGAHHRLVEKFEAQMAAFGTTHYALLYGRSLAMAEDSPLLGYGYDSFRDHCADAAHFRAALPSQPADGGGGEICATHNHNFYAQALTDGGLPGLALFGAMVALWLWPLAMRTRGEPLRIGLFAAAFTALWPVASTSGFFTMPLAGWFFLLLGFGLALTPGTRPLIAAPRRSRPAIRPGAYTHAPGILP